MEISPPDTSDWLPIASIAFYDHIEDRLAEQIRVALDPARLFGRFDLHFDVLRDGLRLDELSNVGGKRRQVEPVGMRRTPAWRKSRKVLTTRSSRLTSREMMLISLSTSGDFDSRSRSRSNSTRSAIDSTDS